MNRRSFFHSAMTGLLAIAGVALTTETAEAQRRVRVVRRPATVVRARIRRRRRRAILIWLK
ncbi:MAG: hypothetical protein U0797_15800 [Gemmataceae bacterium]